MRIKKKKPENELLMLPGVVMIFEYYAIVINYFLVKMWRALEFWLLTSNIYLPTGSIHKVKRIIYDMIHFLDLNMI